jgi:hypothetical protein
MRRQPRAGLRDRWRRIVYADRDISHGCRVLMLYLGDQMTSTGRVSVPRERIAADLGLTERQIARWFADAVRADLLSKVGGGYNGVTSIYEALLKPERSVHPSAAEAGHTMSPFDVTLQQGETAAKGERFVHPNARASLSERQERADEELRGEPLAIVAIERAKQRGQSYSIGRDDAGNMTHVSVPACPLDGERYAATEVGA